MSTQFAFGGFANGVLLGPITAFLGGRLSAVVRNCVLIMAVAYAVQAAIYSEPSMAALAAFAPGGVLTAAQRNAPFVCTTMLLSFFQFSLGTTITAETTAVVPSDMKGTLLGIEHSLFAVARIFGPATGKNRPFLLCLPSTHGPHLRTGHRRRHSGLGRHKRPQRSVLQRVHACHGFLAGHARQCCRRGQGWWKGGLIEDEGRFARAEARLTMALTVGILCMAMPRIRGIRIPHIWDMLRINRIHLIRTS